MATFTFADMHSMVVYLSKSDASAGFDQIVDFLNAHVIQYALMIKPTIYVSCIKKFWASTTIKKVNDVVKLQALIDGKRVVITEDVIRQALHLDNADGDVDVDVQVARFHNMNIFGKSFGINRYKPISLLRN
nr:xylulose kinase-1 [Tanacetum cinerariifolium]